MSGLSCLAEAGFSRTDRTHPYRGVRCPAPTEGFRDYSQPPVETPPVWHHLPPTATLSAGGHKEGGREILNRKPSPNPPLFSDLREYWRT